MWTGSFLNFLSAISALSANAVWVKCKTPGSKVPNFFNMIVFPYVIFVLSADLAIFYQSKVWTCFSFIFMTGYIQVVHERAHRLCSKESKFKLTFFMIYNSQPSNEINIAIFGLFSFCHISSCMYVIQMMSSVCVTIKKKKACPNL